MKITFLGTGRDRRKVFRGMLQAVVLLILLFLLLQSLFPQTFYQAFSEEMRKEGGGFIALSYTGVDRTGKRGLMGVERLDSHLSALYRHGYTTITQQDIKEYYELGKPLPEKSLFLLFEDGRRDTVLYAESLLKKYNYKATMLFYVDKFEKKDSKFISLEDIRQMEKSGFWEFGVNGYRFSYINVFDTEGRYLGDMDTLDYLNNRDSIKSYNHYLMDFRRDAYGVPIETKEEMQARISADYQAISGFLDRQWKQAPLAYALMHANTGQFGTNEVVSEVNENEIKKLFSFNFNREGNSYNDAGHSQYQLTRLRPEASWSANRLLLKIFEDSGRNDSVLPVRQLSEEWRTVQGKAVLEKEGILLTAMPEMAAFLEWKGKLRFTNFQMSVFIPERKDGEQTFLLGEEKAESYFLSIGISNGRLRIEVPAKEKSRRWVESYFIPRRKYSMSEPGFLLKVQMADGKLSVRVNGTEYFQKKMEVPEHGRLVLKAGSQKKEYYDGMFKGLLLKDGSELLYDSRHPLFISIFYWIKGLFYSVVDWFITYL